MSVPPGHPLFGRQHGTLAGIMIGVHGGIDYSNACEEHEPENRSVCHVVASPGHHQEVGRNEEAGHDDAWWFGFSCDQRDDIVPLETRRPPATRRPRSASTTPPKTEAFVYGECVRLAAQLKAIEENRDPRSADPGPTVLAPSHLEYRR